MADEAPEKKKRGCLYLIIKFGIFVVCLYILQWILQLAFEPPGTDSIAQSLKPFQNHYLSFSPHFVATEGASTEFNRDTTAVGRFLALLIPTVMVWLVIIVPSYLIKPLEKYHGYFFWTATVLVFGTLLYSEFFVPYRKATFTQDEIIVAQTEWIFSTTTVRVPYGQVEKLEYDFHKDHDVHTGDLLYSRLFAVIGGKRVLLAENQLLPANDALDPTEEQKAEVTTALDAIEKLVHPSSVTGH